MLFNQNLPIAFESSMSSFSISYADESALKMDTAIGQGKTWVSPLHMVMLMSAICNEGVAMRPQLVNEIENYYGTLVEEVKSKEYKTLFTELDRSEFEKDYEYRGCLEEYTYNGISYAQSSITAQSVEQKLPAAGCRNC